MQVDGHGVLQFEQLGSAVLAHVVLPDAAAAAQWLQSYQQKMLQVDARATDRYGRAEVIASLPDNPLSLQEHMLQQGMAMLYSKKAFAHADDWLVLEAQARTKNRGFWANPDAIIPPERAIQHRHHFAVVQGTAANIYHARDAVYINFGTDWRSDFSIKIPRKAMRSMRSTLTVLERATADSDAPRRVPKAPLILRVRGTVIEENGPMIVALRPEHLEIVPHAASR